MLSFPKKYKNLICYEKDGKKNNICSILHQPLKLLQEILAWQTIDNLKTIVVSLQQNISKQT